MNREPEFWGGELRLPRWLRRFRRGSSADDTPEREVERHEYQDRVGKSDPGKAAQDMLGAWSIMMPREKRRH
jgi:hypothetical protein